MRNRGLWHLPRGRQAGGPRGLHTILVLRGQQPLQGGVGAAPGRPLQVVAGSIKCAVSLVFIPLENGNVILLLLIMLIPLAWGRWGRASLLYRWPLERKCWKRKPALVFVQFETGYQLVWSLYPQLAYSPLGFKIAYINIPRPLCLLQWKICWFVWTLKSQRQMFLSL